MTLPLDWQIAIYAWLDGFGQFLIEPWPSDLATPRVLWIIAGVVLVHALAQLVVWVMRNLELPGGARRDV